MTTKNYEEYAREVAGLTEDELSAMEAELEDAYADGFDDDEGADRFEDDEPWDGFNSDAEADADVLASCGWGTDEDYGYYGDDW